MLASLQEEDDINRVTDYFSYEHFYVIYCKFWDLDSDHDLSIDKSDLFRHNDRGEISVDISVYVLLLAYSFSMPCFRVATCFGRWLQVDK